MDTKVMRRREMLKRVGLLGTSGAVAFANSPAGAKATGDDRIDADDERGDQAGPLVGLWDVTVRGAATYYYTYSFSCDAFVAAGNIDNNWDGQSSSFGPTMGSYRRERPRTYSIREKGWAFDSRGMPAGSFGFVGTYVVDKSGNTLSGGGTWTLYDVGGNAIFVEPLTVTGTKIG